MKNTVFKVFVAILATAMIFVGFVSCNRNDERADDSYSDTVDTSGDQTESGEDADALNIVLNGKSEYRIIYPDNCEEYIKNYANELRQLIREKTRANVQVLTDGGANPANVSDNEILIGKTNRQESIEAYKRLEYNGSKALITKKKIVLAAHTSEAMGCSVNVLKKQLRISKDSKSITVSKLNMYDSGTYPVKKLTVGNYDLWDFAIVATSDEAVALANNIRSLVGKASGVALDIYSSTSELSSNLKPLFIGDEKIPDGESDTYYLFGEVDGGVALYCQDSQARTRAYVDFQTALEVNAAETIDLLVAIKPAKKQDGGQQTSADLKFMSFNVLNGWNTSNIGNRDDKAAEQILAFAPDVLALQEFDDYYRNATGTPLTTLISEKYSEVNANQKSWNPIFYNKNTVTPIAYGHEEYSEGTSYDTYNYQGQIGSKFRTITWVLLEHIESGTQFLVFNTHLDVEGGKQSLQATELINKVSDLKEMFGITNVFLMGDLNSNVNSQTAQGLFNYGFKDTHELAEVKDDLDSAGTKGEAIKESYSSAIDHLYCMGDDINVWEYKTVTSVRDISDHCPIQIKLKIS